MSFNRGMDKQTTVHPYNGQMLKVKKKKGQTIDSSTNVGES